MRLAVLGLLVLLATPAGAQEAPFELNGLVLGADQASVEASSRFACADPQSPAADKLCRLRPGQSETVAGAPIKRLFLYFYSAKLEMISVTLDVKYFVDVITALTKEYGKASVETEAMQNLSGASFENRIYTWRRGNATLEVQTYGRDLENSSMIYRTDFSLQEYTRRSGAKAPGKTKSQ